MWLLSVTPINCVGFIVLIYSFFIYANFFQERLYGLNKGWVYLALKQTAVM